MPRMIRLDTTTMSVTVADSCTAPLKPSGFKPSLPTGPKSMEYKDITTTIGRAELIHGPAGIIPYTVCGYQENKIYFCVAGS